MRTMLFATLAAVGAVALAMPASAGEVNNTSLAAPGVYYGSGNSGTNSYWTVDTESGVELGMEALIRYTTPVQPVPPTANIYNVALGNTANPHSGSLWGFAFSANASTAAQFSALTLSVSITDYLHGTTVTFNPELLPDNAGTNGTTSVGGSAGCGTSPSGSVCGAANRTGLQNAEALSFTNGVASGFDPLYDSSVNDTYLITLTASDGSTQVASTSILVNAGTGSPLPEPASMALLGSALAGLGILRRRRHRG